MKLRIQAGSIRLRLSEAEIQELLEEKLIAEVLGKGGSWEGVLAWSLRVGDDVDVLDLECREGRINFVIAEHCAEAMAQKTRVGVEKSLPAGKDRELKVVIERDVSVKKHRDLKP